MKNRTLFFGEGLFETFKVYRGRRIPWIDEHLARMARGCQFFSLPFHKEKARDTILSVLNEIPEEIEARLRLNLLCYGDQDVSEVRFSANWEVLPDLSRFMSEGVRIGISPIKRFSLSPLVRFKTTSYMENMFVLRWARQHGFFDAIFTNERGEVTEGCISNIFFIRGDEVVVTPPIDAGLLDGITRAKIIEILGSLNIDVLETRIVPDDLTKFKGVFITNSVIELFPVRMIGEVSYSILPMIFKIHKCYQKKVLSLPPISPKPHNGE